MEQLFIHPEWYKTLLKFHKDVSSGLMVALNVKFTMVLLEDAKQDPIVNIQNAYQFAQSSILN